MSAVAPPLPSAWVVSQRWRWATFLHWRAPSDRVAALLPPGTRPDEFDGTSWVGLIAFHLSGFTFRPGIPLPYLGRFPEINVRVYTVDDSGNRGVAFLSMEASRLLTVLGVRAALNLPYVWSSMSIRVDRTVEYSSRRLWPQHPRTRILVRPLAESVEGDPLADFLTARWGMHTRAWGRTGFVRNTHEPWALHRAELLALDDELVAAAGLPGIATRAPDSVLYAPGVTARFSAPRPLTDATRRLPAATRGVSRP